MRLKEFKSNNMEKVRIKVILTSLVLLLSSLFIVIFDNQAKEKMNQSPNPYFFPDNVDTVTYSYVVKNGSGESRIDETEMSLYRERVFSAGILYSLKKDANEKIFENDMDEQEKEIFKPKYFYVQAEKIYLIPDMEIRQDITEEELIRAGTVICLSQSRQEEYFTRDVLGPHEFIKTTDEKCAYYSYNDSKTGGIYEYFVWQIGKGMTEYRRGYRETAENGLYMKGVRQTGFVNSNSFNPYFFPDDNSLIKYNGTFEFFGMDPETGILESKEEEIEVSVSRVKILENGILYNMKIVNDGKFYFDDSETGEYDSNRLDLGYFYVQKDKIFLIRDVEIEPNITERELINEGKIICQSESMEDTLDSGKKGWHESIEVIGDRCHFSSYADYSETDWWEGFVWQKGLGLVEYKSGRGVGDSMIYIILKL